MQSAFDAGRAPPQAILDAPALDSISAEYWDAFEILSAARAYSSSGAPQALMFTDLDAYARRMEIRDFDAFLAVVQSVDAVFIDLTLKSQKQKRKSHGRKNRRTPKAR